MSQYQRMISYLYRYEEDEKKNNVGYARIELRGDSCRVTVQLRDSLSVLPEVAFFRQMPQEAQRIVANRLQKNGNGFSCRIETRVDNIMNTGYSFSEMDGLLIYVSHALYYATTWKDNVKVHLGGDTVSGGFAEDDYSTMQAKTQQRNKVVPEATASGRVPEKMPVSELAPERQMISGHVMEGKPTAGHIKGEAPKRAVEGKHMAEHKTKKRPVSTRATEEQIQEGHAAQNQPVEEWGNRDDISGQTAASQPDTAREPIQTITVATEGGAMPTPQIVSKGSNRDISEVQAAQDLDNLNVPGQQVQLQQLEQELQNGIKQQGESKRQGESKQQELTEERTSTQPVSSQEQQEDTVAACQCEACRQCPQRGRRVDFGRHILDMFPRMYPFEIESIRECVRLELKDIGCLPVSYWSLAGNPFLLHGYYCYRHILFTQISDGGYYIGVPGIFNQDNQRQAKSCGFKQFQTLSEVADRQGAFGYWLFPVTI